MGKDVFLKEPIKIRKKGRVIGKLYQSLWIKEVMKKTIKILIILNIVFNPFYMWNIIPNVFQYSLSTSLIF